jgi:hypothetical protein
MMEGYLPLANYDLTYTGLGGCVTARGFKEIYNPGSLHLTFSCSAHHMVTWAAPLGC